MALYELGGVVPQLAEGECWVAPNATVIGRVALRKDASVWFNAVLRGDHELIEICEGANVQDGCVLHTDPGYPLTVGKHATIGHKVMLHGCTIGEGALIGIGATILNGAVIGNGSIVGAHALIPEGKVIPERSMVMGMPGRVVRELSEEDSKRFAEPAAHYVENWKRFERDLKPL